MPPITSLLAAQCTARSARHRAGSILKAASNVFHRLCLNCRVYVCPSNVAPATRLLTFQKDACSMQQVFECVSVKVRKVVGKIVIRSYVISWLIM